MGSSEDDRDCELAWRLFGDARYERLAAISNGHLYNLRKSQAYRQRRITRDRAAARDRATTGIAPRVGGIVGAFESLATVKYIHGVKADGWPGFSGRLGRRSYWERVVRDEEGLGHVRQYIANNPSRWELDGENPVVAAESSSAAGT